MAPFPVTSVPSEKPGTPALSRGRSRYPFGLPHSPLTAPVVEGLRALRQSFPELRDDVFAKVGDSITASGDCLYCLPTPRLDLGNYAALQHTASYFTAGDAGGRSPFRRDSEAAKIGWSAWAVTLDGFWPLAREFREIHPRFALVQFGTNDVQDRALHVFADRLFDIADFWLGRGVIPVLFTVPPRRDNREAARWIPRYNAVIRGVAQSRQIPLVDYHLELSRLPHDGLARDGIHPNTYSGPLGRNACDFTAEGLRYGYNLRNLLALQALNRVASVVVEGLPAPDPEPPRLIGTGTEADALLIDALPFVDRAVLSLPASAAPLAMAPVSSSTPEVSSSATAGPAPEAPDASPDPSPTLVYRLRLSEPKELVVFGFDRGGIEVDLAVEGPGVTVAHPRNLSVAVPPGEYRVRLTPRGDLVRSGETLLVVLAE